MTETELNRLRESIWPSSVRALYYTLHLSSLDPDRAAAIAKLPEDVKTLMRKVFRTVHFLEPSELNLDLYLNEHEVFIEDLASYSGKVIQDQVCREDLLDEQDIAALPKLLCEKERRQRYDDLDRQPDTGLEAGSSGASKDTSVHVPAQQSLDDIGGEPLAGSGFENEQVEPESTSAGKEN